MKKNIISFIKILLPRKHPAYIIFHVTSKCNSNCKMCFNYKHLNNKDIKDLTIEEIEKISRKLNYVYHLTIGGGEPFIRNDIYEIGKLFVTNNNTSVIQIPTNCLFPDNIEKSCKKLLKEFPDLNLKITLSVDGIKDDHDFIRGVPGNFEKFEDTYKRLSQLKKIYPNLDIDVGTTITKLNENFTIELYDYISNNYNIEMHKCTYVRGEIPDKDIANPSLSQYEKIISYIEHNYKSKKFNSHNPFKIIFIAIHIIARQMVLDELKSSKRKFHCPACKGFILIRSNGDIFPCEYLEKRIGSFRNSEYDIKNIIKSDDFLDVITYIKNKKCKCTWECAIKSAIVYSPKYWMNLLKEIINIMYCMVKEKNH